MAGGGFDAVTAATLLVVGCMWLVPMSSSLWLDELITTWVVKDGFAEMVHRSVAYQQPPLYYVIAWITRVIGGDSEIVLRLPSLAASVVSAVILGRVVRRLISAEAARFAVLVFVASNIVAFEASEARPYAIAVLAIVASTAALLRWLDDGTWRWGIVYCALALMVVWLHYLMALALASQVLYILVRLRRRDSRVPARHLITMTLIFLAGVVPLLPEIGSLWSRRSLLSIPFPVSGLYLAVVLLPPVLMASIFLGLLLARTQGSVSFDPVPARASTWVLLTTWLLIPIATLFLAALLTSTTVLSFRYFASTVPALAALAGWGIASIHPPEARRVVAIVIALVSVLAFGGYLKNGEDWRGAAAFERSIANPTTVVLFQPSLIESSHLDWFDDPERRSYLLSVTSYYPMTGHLILIPYRLDAPATAYVEQLVQTELLDQDRFLFVTHSQSDTFQAWFSGRLTQEGYASRVVGSFDVVKVIEFSR
jgi:hypothetical protein